MARDRSALKGKTGRGPIRSLGPGPDDPRLRWIQELYEAAFDCARWPVALGAFARPLGAAWATLDVETCAGGERRLCAAWRRRGGDSPPAARDEPGRRLRAIALEFGKGTATLRFPVGREATARLVLGGVGGTSRESGALARAIGSRLGHLERALRLALRSATPPCDPRPAAPAGASALAPERWHEIEGELVRDRGLTPAEARVAVHFARGAAVGQVARHLHIGVETVRTHLKRVYQKLGTTRQAELVHLLLTNGHVLPPGPPRRG